MQKFTRHIVADDFEVGRKLMVSKSRRKPMPDGHVAMDFMLKGALIEIKSMNLPFILVTASCPMRGKQDLIVDVRDHEFVRVSPEFAEAVLASAMSADEIANAESELAN